MVKKPAKAKKPKPKDPLKKAKEAAEKSGVANAARKGFRS